MYPVVSSEYATAIVLLMEPDGSIRICGYYKVILSPNREVAWYSITRIQGLCAHANKIRSTVSEVIYAISAQKCIFS